MPVAIILLIFSNFRLDAFREICSSYKRRIYHAHCKIASELRLNSKILLKRCSNAEIQDQNRLVWGIEDPTLPRKRRRPKIIDNYFTTTANNTTYISQKSLKKCTERYIMKPSTMLFKLSLHALINLSGQYTETRSRVLKMLSMDNVMKINAVHEVFGDDINKTDLNASRCTAEKLEIKFILFIFFSVLHSQ